MTNITFTDDELEYLKLKHKKKKKEIKKDYFRNYMQDSFYDLINGK